MCGPFAFVPFGRANAHGHRVRLKSTTTLSRSSPRPCPVLAEPTAPQTAQSSFRAMPSDASMSKLPSALLVVIALEPDHGCDRITSIKTRVILSKGFPTPEDSQMTAITATQQDVHEAHASGSKETLLWDELNETVHRLRRENDAIPRSVAVISTFPLANKFKSLGETILCGTRRKKQTIKLPESDYTATWEEFGRM